MKKNIIIVLLILLVISIGIKIYKIIEYKNLTTEEKSYIKTDKYMKKILFEEAMLNANACKQKIQADKLHYDAIESHCLNITLGPKLRKEYNKIIREIIESNGIRELTPKEKDMHHKYMKQFFCILEPAGTCDEKLIKSIPIEECILYDVNYFAWEITSNTEHIDSKSTYDFNNWARTDEHKVLLAQKLKELLDNKTYINPNSYTDKDLYRQNVCSEKLLRMWKEEKKIK